MSKKQNIIFVAAILLLCLAAVIGIQKAASTMVGVEVNDDYVILAANDLGMHCIQKDYTDFLILPPANNIRVQVFKRSQTSDPELVTDGIIVHYEFKDNTSSADKINFWEYAESYGFDLEPNIGLTGNGLKGDMKLSKDKKYYEAVAVPLVPYTDSERDKLQPYQLAQITVLDQKTKRLLAATDSVVVPVSDELNCGICHGEVNTGENILKVHDYLSKTTLTADLKNNIRHKCADCHKDNALMLPGVDGVPSFSEAIHGFHADKMKHSDITPVCYSCHPGPVTQCNRGQMAEEGITCDNKKCHGPMQNVADSQKAGRQAWIDEPDCGNCHGTTYAANIDLLYKDSFLLNAPSKEMSNLIRCQSCHNSTHAEWVSTLELDNELPKSILGYKSFIDSCSVCHTDKGKGKVHQNGESE